MAHARGHAQPPTLSVKSGKWCAHAPSGMHRPTGGPNRRCVHVCMHRGWLPAQHRERSLAWHRQARLHCSDKVACQIGTSGKLAFVGMTSELASRWQARFRDFRRRVKIASAVRAENARVISVPRAGGGRPPEPRTTNRPRTTRPSPPINSRPDPNRFCTRFVQSVWGSGRGPRQRTEWRPAEPKNGPPRPKNGWGWGHVPAGGCFGQTRRFERSVGHSQTPGQRRQPGVRVQR